MATTGTATPTPILIAELSFESDEFISAGEPFEFTQSVDVTWTVTEKNPVSTDSAISLAQIRYLEQQRQHRRHE